MDRGQSIKLKLGPGDEFTSPPLEIPSRSKFEAGVSWHGPNKGLVFLRFQGSSGNGTWADLLPQPPTGRGVMRCQLALAPWIRKVRAKLRSQVPDWIQLDLELKAVPAKDSA